MTGAAVKPTYRVRTHGNSFLRTATRKNSCSIILCINIAFMVILIVSIYSCINYFIFAFSVMSRDRKDRPMMDKYAALFDQYECPFKEPDEYSMEYCSKYCDNNSVITRLRRLDKNSKGWYLANKNKRASCMNQLEMLDCHESLAQHECLPRRKTITECNIMIESVNNNKTMPHLVIVPAVEKILKKWVDSKRVVFANELVIHCPNCLIISQNFRFPPNKVKMDGCFVKLETKGKGWPANAEYCENVQKIKEESCPLLKDTF